MTEQSPPDPDVDPVLAESPKPASLGQGHAALHLPPSGNDFHYNPALLSDPDTNRNAHDREWDRVYQEFHPRLCNYFQNRTLDGDQLDDVIAHVWRTALRWLGKLESTRSAWSWLVTVGVNRLTDLQRGETAGRQRYERLAHEAIVSEDLQARLPDALERMASRDPFDEYRWPVDRGTFTARWNALSEPDRRMIWLHDVEEWTHEEIAQALDIMAGTARQRYARATKHLREG